MTFSAILFNFHFTCRANLRGQHAPTAPAKPHQRRLPATQPRVMHERHKRPPFTLSRQRIAALKKKAHQPLHASHADDAPQDRHDPHDILLLDNDIPLLDNQGISNEVLGAAEAQQLQALPTMRTATLRCNMNEGEAEAEKSGRVVEAQRGYGANGTGAGGDKAERDGHEVELQWE